MLTDSKLELQKTLIGSKWKEGNAEFSGATRSSKAISNEYYTEGFIVKSKDFERIADTNKNKSPLARIILDISKQTFILF